jgi:hypothetical protein
MQLRNLFSAPERDEQMRNQRDEERTSGGGGRLGEQFHSGRLAIGTGTVWIVRALRSRRKRGRQLALGLLALGVGLLQRRSRTSGGETLSSAEYTDALTGTADEGKAGMTEVELGESDRGTEEPPEDMQSDMEASGEMTDDEEDFGIDEESEVDTDEHETDIGEAGDVDLDTDESDEETGTTFGDETEEIGTDETAAETDADEGEETEE